MRVFFSRVAMSANDSMVQAGDVTKFAHAAIRQAVVHARVSC